MMKSISFGDKLRMLRLEKGFSSCEKLARAINAFYGKPALQIDKKPGWIIHPLSLRKYESNECLPKQPRVYDLLKEFFGVSREYLEYPDVTTREFEHTGIGKETGLSDKAINVLKTIKEFGLESFINKTIERESFCDFIINRSIKSDIAELITEVENQYEKVIELQENYKNPYEEYLKIDNQIMELGTKYSNMEANLEAYFPFTQRHLDFLVEYSEYNKDDYSYKSFENDLQELKKNLYRAMNLIDFNGNEFLVDLRKQ